MDHLDSLASFGEWLRRRREGLGLTRAEPRLAPDRLKAAEASALTVLLETHVETILSSSSG